MGKICSGFGHADGIYYEKDRRSVENILRFLIEEYGADTFYSGTHGSFDIMFSESVAALRPDYPHLENILVLSFRPNPERRGYRLPERYDGTIYLLEKPCHYKAAIGATTRAMADRSSFVVAGVNIACGGAYEACRYAERRGVPVYNIYHSDFDAFPFPGIL